MKSFEWQIERLASYVSDVKCFVGNEVSRFPKEGKIAFIVLVCLLSSLQSTAAPENQALEQADA